MANLDKLFQNIKSKPEGLNINAQSYGLISDNLIDLCNYRIQQEEYSNRIYLAMSKWLNNKGYLGASSLWEKYAKEESEHAELIYNFLLDLGIQPIVPELTKPQQEFSSLMEIVKLSYEHEVEVYKQCAELAKVAFTEGQLMLYPIALHLTKEQAEEVSKLQNWLDMFVSFGTSQEVILMIDNKMGG